MQDSDDDLSEPEPYSEGVGSGDDELLGQELDDDEDEMIEQTDAQMKAKLGAFTIIRPPTVSRTKSEQSNYDNEEEAQADDLVPAELTEEQMQGRLEAYESVGVVSALLAGFAFAGLTAVDRDELEKVNWWIILCFAATSSFTIALNFYSMVCATWIYYWGKLILGHGEVRPTEFFLQNEYVRKYRHNGVVSMMVSIPVFLLSLAAICFVKLPEDIGCMMATFLILSSLVVAQMMFDMYYAFCEARMEIMAYQLTDAALPNQSTWNNIFRKYLYNQYGLVIFIILGGLFYTNRGWFNITVQDVLMDHNEL